MTYLADNVDGASYIYIITVLTGMFKKSATTAKVSIRIMGDKGTSEKHTLYDKNAQLFQPGDEDWFILAEAKCLGRLKGLTVWVDYSNTAPSW